MFHPSNGSNKGLSQSETTSGQKEKRHCEDEQLSKISFIVLIVDIVPQKCHVRSHKSRAEITNSSYLSFASLASSLHKSLLTFMYKYIQFIDYSGAGMVGCSSLLWWLCCWFETLAEKRTHGWRHVSQCSTCLLNHGHQQSTRTEPNTGRGLYTGMLSAIIHVVKKGGGMPTTREHRRHKCRKSPAAKALALFLF